MLLQKLLFNLFDYQQVFPNLLLFSFPFLHKPKSFLLEQENQQIRKIVCYVA